MSKQVRIRRDSKTNLNSVVPASSELAHETTNNRIHIGNGATQGGVILPNARDVQNNNFITGTIGGTANAITLTIADPPTAYASGQQFLIRPTANNTGATTINVNGLGAVNILKNVNGTLTALIADDLRTNIWYEITYDGTQFQLGGGGGGANPLITSYTPIFQGLGSPTSVQFYYIERFKFLDVWGSFVCGAPSGVEGRIGLPSGMTSSSSIPSSITHCGNIYEDGVPSYDRLCLIEPSVTYITYGLVGYGASSFNGLIKRNGNFGFVNGVRYSVKFSIPIA